MNFQIPTASVQSSEFLCVFKHFDENQQNEPYYFYIKDKILDKCKKFLTLTYKDTAIHFASMANAHPDFLKIIRNEGIKIFVNSQMHLDLALDAGFLGEEIIFTASAMSEETMQKVASHNVIVNLDSLSQLAQWQRLFPHLKAGLRCNIGDSVKAKQTRGGYFIGKNSRLGLSIEEIEQLKGNTQINGLHLYVGTDILDIDYFIDCYKELIKLSKYFPFLEYIDMGGGFGVKEQTDEEFNFEAYDKAVTSLMEKFSSEMGRSIKLILEPGRIMGAEAGYFVCKVIDVKERGGIQYIGVNASSAQFPRPLLYPDDSWHPVTIFDPQGNKKNELFQASFIYGCSTYSRDFLAREINLPKTEINDIVILGNAGAYCASSHLKFLGFKQAKEIFI